MYKYLSGLDPDLCTDLIRRFRNLWMHGTVEKKKEIAGNGDAYVFEIRVKPSEKPLEAYQRESGHIRAIQWVSDTLCCPRPFTNQDLFELHRILLAKSTSQESEPVGSWKTEPNCTFLNIAKEIIYYQYADPEDVPFLMNRWLDLLNDDMDVNLSMQDAAECYARLHLTFVWIHPFFNGNGRMARLLSNVPVLWAGFPPILVSERKRTEYLHLLDEFLLAKGRVNRNSDLDLCDECVCGFCEFCTSSWLDSLDMLTETWRIQRARNHMRQGPQFCLPG